MGFTAVSQSDYDVLREAAANGNKEAAEMLPSLEPVADKEFEILREAAEGGNKEASALIAYVPPTPPEEPPQALQKMGYGEAAAYGLAEGTMVGTQDELLGGGLGKLAGIPYEEGRDYWRAQDARAREGANALAYYPAALAGGVAQAYLTKGKVNPNLQALGLGAVSGAAHEEGGIKERLQSALLGAAGSGLLLAPGAIAASKVGQAVKPRAEEMLKRLLTKVGWQKGGAIGAAAVGQLTRRGPRPATEQAAKEGLSKVEKEAYQEALYRSGLAKRPPPSKLAIAKDATVRGAKLFGARQAGSFAPKARILIQSPEQAVQVLKDALSSEVEKEEARQYLLSESPLP